MMLIASQKSVNNLLRKILPEPEFEPGASCLSEAGVFKKIFVDIYLKNK